MYSWEVQAEGDTVTVTAGTLYGKKVVSPYKVEEKNIGRSNATTLEEQAIKEAQALWTFKVSRKYSETQEDAQEDLMLPMLANDYEKKKKKVKWPATLQPKLDGVRCLARWEDNKVVLTSRNGLEWTAVPHINEALASILPKGAVSDGELYIHGKNFQEITRRVKKAKPESLEIEYHIYDLPTGEGGKEELTWALRQEGLEKMFKAAKLHKDSKIKQVVSYEVNSEIEAFKIHDELVALGYEGAIIRLQDNVYLYGYRSDGLLKIKKFEDHEFSVTSYENGIGKYENSVIWICVTETGKTFKVNPKISIAEKEEFLKNAKSYIGQKLKVRFFGRSEEGTPRFPVGIGFRLKQDMD
jgi:ATP-dependent DNA ligase